MATIRSEGTSTLRGRFPTITCNFTPNIAYWTKDSGHYAERTILQQRYAASINLAIQNHRPITLNLNDFRIVTLSPQRRKDDDYSNFTITHEIKVTNDRGHFSDAELDEFRDKLRIVFSVINVRCCEIVLVETFDTRSSLTGYMIDQLHCDSRSISMFCNTQLGVHNETKKLRI